MTRIRSAGATGTAIEATSTWWSRSTTLMAAHNRARHGRSLRQPVRDRAARSPAALLTVGLRPVLLLMGGGKEGWAPPPATCPGPDVAEFWHGGAMAITQVVAGRRPRAPLVRRAGACYSLRPTPPTGGAYDSALSPRRFLSLAGRSLAPRRPRTGEGLSWGARDHCPERVPTTAHLPRPKQHA